MISHEPVWAAPSPPRPGRLPGRADVLIVGGGITGVSLLRAIRGRAGAALVERDRLAAGASGRNAGFLLAGVVSSYAAAVRRLGRQRTRALWRFTADTHDLLAEALAGRAAGYRRRGSIVRAASPEEGHDLEESETLLREDGFDVRWDGRDLHNAYDGEIDPAEAVGILAGDVPAGSIREGVTVDAIEAGPGGVRVRSGADECLAGSVVLATNAWTCLLAPDVPIRPVRAQMLATAPEPRPVARRPTYADHGFQYWRQLPDGRVLVGGYRDRAVEEEVGHVAATTDRVQAHLDRHLRELGAGAPVTHRWAGIMGFTDDALPIVGPLPGRPGVYVCGGYTGHGMGFAFQCASRLADALTGRRPMAGLLP